MKITDVRKLPSIEQFLYWCRERHQVHLRRKAGLPKPWTDDEVLQRFFFTNPYRENDKTTVWFREQVRDVYRDRPEVLFATVCFRWFNLIETGRILVGTGLLTKWDPDKCLAFLRPLRDRGEKVFTGAFMINSPGGEPKLEAIVRRVNNVWEQLADLLHYYSPGFGDNDGESPSMEAVHGTLTTFDGMGGFMAYEVVCDLRYTYLLENAEDKMTWCNPGPGCSRGLHRIKGLTWASKGNNATAPPLPRDWLITMKGLLLICRQRLKRMPPFEMREVEHSLCEYDKYMRAVDGDGKMKRTFKGV